MRSTTHRRGESKLKLPMATLCFGCAIRDDGNGIDPEVLGQGSRAGHWGLPGMHERAKRIGGHLNVWSRPGAGTEVELTVPGSIAYETSRSLGAGFR